MGGNPNVLIAKPCVTLLKLCKKSDFIILGCNLFFNYFFLFLGDGIFDHLENDDILKTIWGFKKKGSVFEDIHELSGYIADAIIKYSMKKLSVDNVTVIFVMFQNFADKMKDENFEYNYTGNTCKFIGGEIDLNNID